MLYVVAVWILLHVVDDQESSTVIADCRFAFFPELEEDSSSSWVFTARCSSRERRHGLFRAAC